MTKGQDTRQRVVRTAAELFQRQGYHATGVNQILSTGRAPKGSLYFHFPGGKEQVAVEAVTASGAALGDRLRAALDAADPADGLTRLVDLLAAALAGSDYEQGCPVAGIAIDTASTSEPIRAACADAYGRWLEIIETALTDWGVPVDQAAALAVTLFSALEGALLLARVRRDTGPLRALVAPLATLITATATATATATD
ncbi:TetR/AcrR family transcriptional regulator [Micromonospora zhanjiangensis]